VVAGPEIPAILGGGKSRIMVWARQKLANPYLKKQSKDGHVHLQSLYLEDESRKTAGKKWENYLRNKVIGWGWGSYGTVLA
jgi:hypothetical protein